MMQTFFFIKTTRFIKIILISVGFYDIQCLVVFNRIYFLLHKVGSCLYFRYYRVCWRGTTILVNNRSGAYGIFNNI